MDFDFTSNTSASCNSPAKTINKTNNDSTRLSVSSSISNPICPPSTGRKSKKGR
eukprot:CAMPEP_0118669394 /NCGR_PEP_ID=MMETSP0785-20121206/20875_1 /TAXON_ID=91992 /ORGANISM="Bolidomonas pacifica, Strain CCMP 1866" /LENGTH=53 /DNA_ID=CAMNT_0006564069 /DNA_START=8 /DNA_END=166 /DNA_ORIENTATION=+